MAATVTAIWRIRPSGSDTNGGGYDPGIAGAGTDFSQQNAAQVSQSSTANTSTATTTLTDTGASFTSALIGNAIWVSGTGLATTWTYITAVPTSTTLTLQTSPGTTGTAVSYNIGGGWATFANTSSSPANVVGGNIVYVLGSGTPNPASYTYDYAPAAYTPNSGGGTGLGIIFANDPLTPGYKAFPDTTGGMPTVQVNGAFWAAGSNVGCVGLWFVLSGTNANGLFNTAGNFSVKGCVFDQLGFDSSITANGKASNGQDWYACEIFSSVAPISTSAAPALSGSGSGDIFNCNIHDTVGPGIRTNANNWHIINTIVAKCRGYGIQFPQAFSGVSVHITNCTIDGNTGSGIDIATNVNLMFFSYIFSNIISNHTGGGTSGLTVSAGGTAAANSRNANFIDYNVYYNNVTDVTNINYGPHDVHGGSNPYVGQATENYTLA